MDETKLVFFIAHLLKAKRVLEAAGIQTSEVETDPELRAYGRPGVVYRQSNTRSEHSFGDRIWTTYSGLGQVKPTKLILIEHAFLGANSKDTWTHPSPPAQLRLCNDSPLNPETPGKVAMILEAGGISCMVRDSVRVWMRQQAEKTEKENLYTTIAQSFLDEETWVSLGDLQ